MSSPSPPPTLAVGAAYDTLLQSALRQFFERATLDTEMTPSVSSDGRLAIEPSANPAALIVRWFGTRYTLRVPGRWVFTAHEVRLAQAIGAVLAARFSAILNPRIIAERGDLFRGAIEDRYVGAFLDPRCVRDRGARGARRPRGLDHRVAASRGAFQLRKPADFHWRSAARDVRGSVSSRYSVVPTARRRTPSR